MKHKIAIILAAIMIIVTFSACTSNFETRDIKSLSLASEQSISGAFVLGIGGFSSDSSDYYYVYIKGNEGYGLNKIPTDYAEIVETNDVSPCMKGHFAPGGRVVLDAAGDIYTIYVPEGTIYEKYTANPSEAKEKG